MRVSPRLAGHATTSFAANYRKLYDRLNALPGIRSATLARHSPAQRLAKPPICVQDAAGAPLVAMVNETFVRTYLGGRDPIGWRFGMEDAESFCIDDLPASRAFKFTTTDHR